ncbi:MAG: DUF6677 family protein [Pirellulaceae bacterium]
MPTEKSPSTPEMLQIDLRNPAWAAFWAWLCPGAGHLYQKRYAKGVLFMVCILGTFFSGLTLGKGHVVYASWTKNDKRWQYLCQLGVGAPAFPALIQSRRVRNGAAPLWSGFMAPPNNVADPNNEAELHRDELAEWHLELNSRFELGTLYTMIAGLLNVLAIYDAYAGPVISVPEEEQETDKPPDRKKKKTA